MPRDSKNSILQNFSPCDPDAGGQVGKSIKHRPPVADHTLRAEPPSELTSPLHSRNTSRANLGSLAKRVAPKPMAVEAERYLTVRDVAQRFAVSIQTVWRWAKERSEFPKPVELSPGTTRWRMSDLIAFECGLSRDKR